MEKDLGNGGKDLRNISFCQIKLFHLDALGELMEYFTTNLKWNKGLLLLHQEH